MLSLFWTANVGLFWPIRAISPWSLLDSLLGNVAYVELPMMAQFGVWAAFKFQFLYELMVNHLRS